MVQVKVLQTEAADASAKIAALEERYQEERALRRRVSPCFALPCGRQTRSQPSGQAGACA